MYSVKCNLCQLRIDLEFVPSSIIRQKLFLILFCTSFDRCVLFYTIESTWLKFQIFLVPQSLEISCVLIETNYKNKCEPSENSVLFDAKEARYIKIITFSNVGFEFIPACLLAYSTIISRLQIGKQQQQQQQFDDSVVFALYSLYYLSS